MSSKRLSAVSTKTEDVWQHPCVKPHRRMRDAAFRQSQLDHLHAPHIAPLTDLIDELIRTSGRGWMPYIAPLYGGVNARMLSVLRDPGPATQAGRGSGLLCCENDDATADLMATLMDEVGLPTSAMLPWNAYPWYINRKPTAAELEAGTEPLRRVIELLPELRVVLLHGGDAHTAWRRFARQCPTVADGPAVIATYHTSRQAFWHKDPAVRQERLDKLRADLARAVALAEAR